MYLLLYKGEITYKTCGVFQLTAYVVWPDDGSYGPKLAAKKRISITKCRI
jgi:hypothetical protein